MSASPGWRRICPRRGWNCCATTWARAARSRFDTASNDIVATHCAIQVPSLAPIAAALAESGQPLTGSALMILREGTRAALITGPDGHRFLVEERRATAGGAAA